MAATRAQQAESTRRKILDAAVRLFLDKNYDEVSVQDLAQAAGVSYGSVAHHFGNKRGIHREAVRQIARQLEQTPPAPGPPGTRIRMLLQGHLASARENPPAYLGLLLGTDADSRALVESGKQLAVQSTAEILDLDPDHRVTDLVLGSWVNAVSQASATWLRDGGQIADEDMTQWLVATLAEMLGSAVALDSSFDPGPALEALDEPGT